MKIIVPFGHHLEFFIIFFKKSKEYFFLASIKIKSKISSFQFLSLISISKKFQKLKSTI
jgi:hypothetical protein